jgi:thymidylate kinase
MCAKLIVIEGPDRVGKETQSYKLFSQIHTETNSSAAIMEVPINDRLTYPLIYWMLRNGLAKKFPNLFQTIQFLNKLLFQILHLPALLSLGDYVILDRWSLSAIVYGDASGSSRWLNRFFWRVLKKPDLTLILHGPMHKRHDVPDSYETDTSLQLAVRRGYYDWAQEHPDDHELIDSQGTVSEVHERIICVVRERFAR